MSIEFLFNIFANVIFLEPANVFRIPLIPHKVQAELQFRKIQSLKQKFQVATSIWSLRLEVWAALPLDEVQWVLFWTGNVKNSPLISYCIINDLCNFNGRYSLQRIDKIVELPIGHKITTPLKIKNNNGSCSDTYQFK